MKDLLTFQVSPRATAAALLALTLVACASGESSDDSGPPPPPPAAKKAPAKASLGSPQAVFIGTNATSESGPRTKSLMTVALDGTIGAVTFADEDDVAVTVEVTKVEPIGDDHFGLEFSYSDGTATRTVRALLRVSDGRLFDVSGFNLAEAQVKGGYLFAMSTGYAPANYSYTLYKIELATMLATALNNPTYDAIPYPSLPFLIDLDLDLRLELSGYSTKIFFADNSPPLAESVSSVTFCPTGGNSGQLAKVYGEDGKIYAFCVSNVPDMVDPLKRYMEYYVATVDFTAGGTVITPGSVLRTATCTGATPGTILCPETRLAPAPASSYRVQNRSRYVPITSGFFTMSPITGGGISLTWTDLPMPALTLISGAYGYWKEGDSIKRIHFVAGASEEVVVTAANIIGWKVAGGVLIYTKYITGTNIGTYRVITPGADPELLMSEDMEVQQIVEL